MRGEATVAARVGGASVSVLGSHEERGWQEVVVDTMGLSVPLGFADLVAALHLWSGVTAAELGDDEYVRQLLVEAVVNKGLQQVTEWRDRIVGVPAGVDGWLDLCRHRVAEVFGLPAASDGSAASWLAGVA